MYQTIIGNFKHTDIMGGICVRSATIQIAHYIAVSRVGYTPTYSPTALYLYHITAFWQLVHLILLINDD